MTTALAHISRARAEIEQAKSLDDVIELMDRAAAIKHFMAKREGSLAVALDAAEIKLRCERRAGELLKETPKQKPGQYQRSHDTTVAPKLSEIGVDKSDAHRWQTIASLPDDAFEGYIAECRGDERDITTAGALLLAKTARSADKKNEAQSPTDNGCRLADLESLVLAGAKFGTIYADPPWQYGNQATRASTDNHYQTMSIEEICGLPIGSLSGEISHLHLWTTSGFLRQAFDVIDAWGFTYKSGFVWVKPQMGIGNYWRVSHEYLLLGVRGAKVFEEHDEMSWGQFSRGPHSAKPEEIRLKIERVSPGPRLELFGRRTSPGWTVWGNQVERDLLTAVSE